MKYISTRGDKTEFSSSQAVIAGLAKDGGLFVPKNLPVLDVPLEELSKKRLQRDRI